MDNRRVLLAVLLSMAVIIGWQLLFPPPEPPAPPERQPVEVGERPGAEQEAPTPSAAETGEERGGRPEEAAAGESGEPAGAPGRPEELEEVAAEREERVVLETETFRATFSNRGAELRSLELLEYGDGEGAPVDLVRDRSAGMPYPFGLVDPSGEPLAVADALFAVERGRDGDGNPEVRFVRSGPEGRVEKRFTGLGRGLLGVAIEARGVGPWGLVLGPGMRNPTARDEERRFGYRGAVYLAADEIEKVPGAKTENEIVLPGPGLEWIGIEDTYFLSVVIPRTPLDRAVVQPYVVAGEGGEAPRFERIGPGGANGEQEELRHELRVTVVPEGETFEGVAYLGAKKLDRLGDLPWRLQETVRLGVFGILARPILIGLEWIYENLVANYGWAIVLMTVLIELLMLPLTFKSYSSMEKMQQLAPQIKAIRAKYKSKLRDKKGRPDIEQQRKMNEEIQALYRAEGVNPAGGCLPMLLQFPVLFAFYRILSHAVELRDAPWILWIEDLSMHDPIYVLPIVMGAVQFLQQRMAPPGGDPMQRRMMMAMPVVFTFLFGFPSGLVLYWLTRNVLTLIQRAVHHRLKAKSSEAS